MSVSVSWRGRAFDQKSDRVKLIFETGLLLFFFESRLLFLFWDRSSWPYMFPDPASVFWSNSNEIRSSEPAFWDMWQPFQVFPREFITCFLVLVLVQSARSCQELFQSLTPMPATQITMKFPYCNSNFPQFQGDSPSVTKGTSGVAVVGTRGELNRYSPTEIQSCVETLLSRVFDNVLYACAQLLLSGKLWITFCIRWGAEVIGRQGNGLRLKVSIFSPSTFLQAGTHLNFLQTDNHLNIVQADKHFNFVQAV